MSGPFAHLCTGTETLADVVADAEAHGWAVMAQALLDARPRDLAERVRQGARRVRDARVAAARWLSFSDASLEPEVLLHFAWRAYRARRRAS